MTMPHTGDLWWKTAIVYCLDVETYMDWNDDGIGDFVGLAHRMDYLAELGVTCLWLMPFYPTPDRDDGYDVSDFYGVDARLGHLGDVVEVLRMAKDRGLRVIADLVVNHTSDKHPWFVEATSSRSSPYRDFYVWRDEPPENEKQTVFPGEESSVWELDKASGQYYRHSFYSHQPDLNLANQKVRDEIAKVIGFWLQMGFAGFRVDAVPFFLDTVSHADDFSNPHAYLNVLRSFVSRRSGDGIFLGEVNLPREDQLLYFGGKDGDQLSMQFDFLGMQKLYLSLAREDARPFAAALAERPAIDETSQWVNFVRNHDELTLDQLSEDERAEVFDAFAPEEHQRVYGRGIVRRLPPMLGGDPRRIKMVYSLLFSLPGAPALFYGEEIGMGENPDLAGRNAVRSPMQWTNTPNAGFSQADEDDLLSPVVDGAYGPAHVNASEQRHDTNSLWSFMQRLTGRYRTSPEIGWGALTVLPQQNDSVLAHMVTDTSGQMLAVHNFGTEAASVALVLDGLDSSVQLIDLLGDENVVRPTDAGAVELMLDGYGYRWLRVLRPGEKRLA